jgi:hypothetical protein
VANTHVLGEVAHLIALATLDIISGTRLWTLLGVMAFLLAILAGVGVDPLLGTVASAVTGLLAVDTFDSWLDGLLFGNLLLTVLIYV